MPSPRPLAAPALLLTLLAAPAAVAATPRPAVAVEGAWARPAPAGVTVSAAYFTLRNTGAEPVVLEGVTSPLAAASLHESTAMDMGGAGGSGGMGMTMRMKPAGPLTVAPHGALVLKPGGFHVMLEGLKGPLAAGGHAPLALHFRGGASVAVQAPVRVSAP